MRAYVRECVRVGCVSDRVTSQRAGWEGSGGGRGRGCAVVGVERSTTHSHSHAQRAASFETGKMEGSKCDAIFFFSNLARRLWKKWLGYEARLEHLALV